MVCDRDDQQSQDNCGDSIRRKVVEGGKCPRQRRGMCRCARRKEEAYVAEEQSVGHHGNNKEPRA